MSALNLQLQEAEGIEWWTFSFNDLQEIHAIGLESNLIPCRKLHVKRQKSPESFKNSLSGHYWGELPKCSKK